MSNEIKVGDWTLTETGVARLRTMSAIARVNRARLQRFAVECCEILGVDPATDAIARDMAEEIVLHGTPVMEVVAKLHRHLTNKEGDENDRSHKV